MESENSNSYSINEIQKKTEFQNNNPLFIKDSSVDFKSLLQLQLQQYDDVEDEDFQIVEDNFEEELRKAKQYQSTYMHQHSNIIPIGTNYQALIPQILPQHYYKIKSRDMMKRLQILKINDPVRLHQFVEKHKQIVKKYFQPFQLTQQDYSIMYNNYKQYGNQGDVPFDKYLDKTVIYWNKYFLGKQKLVAKTMARKKKKKNKGSIPI